MNVRGNKWWWVAVATVALVALSMAGCSDLGSPLKLLPHIELSPAALDFGTVVVSGATTRSVLVGNSGNAPLNGFAAVACPGYSIDSGRRRVHRAARRPAHHRRALPTERGRQRAL